VPEENFWTLWCKGRLMEADTLTIRLGATPSRLTSAYLIIPHIFYTPDALPAAQPTASKHHDFEECIIFDHTGKLIQGCINTQRGEPVTRNRNRNHATLVM